MTMLGVAGRCRPKALELEVFRRGDNYRSRDRDVSIAGNVSIDIGVAPSLIINDDARWLRRQLTSLPPLPPIDVRLELLRSALGYFRGGRVVVPSFGEQGPDDFTDLLESYCGLPPALTDRWFDLLESQLGRIDHPDPGAAGGIEAISFPANTFVCLEACFKALLRSDAVWIRPSRREPFSGPRFLGSLLAAGWPALRVSMYPTRHDGLLAFVGAADRAQVYGGSELPRELGRMSHVQVHGAGRTRALVGGTADLRRASHWLSRSIAGDSGRFCTNTGTILCASNADVLGRGIAAELDSISVGADIDARFPQARPTDKRAAEQLISWVSARLRADDAFLTTRPPLVTTPDGGISYAPTLIRLGSPEGHPLIGMELPFAIAVLAEVSEGSQAAFCRDANFVHVLGYDDVAGLARQLPHAVCTRIDLESEVKCH